MRGTRKTKLTVAAMSLLLAFAVTGCSGSGQTTAGTNPGTATASEDKAYLKRYFDVEVKADAFTADAFSSDLKKVAGEEAPAVASLQTLEVVKAAVAAADYEELALSYPAEKVKARLDHHGVKKAVAEPYGAYLACAMDTGLITAKEGVAAAENKDMAAAAAEELLMNIAEANGDGRNYLGMSDDPAIYGKIDQAWNSFLLFDDGTLSEVGRKAVVEGISTGYGLKSSAFDARFLPELTLQYGHSDIKHAHQLIGLLNSEGITARVQLEPKISIYQYLLEWGPVPEATPTYEVKQFDDLYLVYAVEYDMQLEFASEAQMRQFDSVIKAYAKKNEGNEDAVGMISGAWWQPLYSSVRTDMPAEDFHQIYDCVIQNGIFSIHPFALPENKDNVVKELEGLAGGLKVTPVERYCNTAFHNYMTGADYQ